MGGGGGGSTCGLQVGPPPSLAINTSLSHLLHPDVHSLHSPPSPFSTTLTIPTPLCPPHTSSSITIPSPSPSSTPARLKQSHRSPPVSSHAWVAWKTAREAGPVWAMSAAQEGPKVDVEVGEEGEGGWASAGGEER